MNNCYTKNLTVYDINEVCQNFKSVKKKPNKSKPCIENGRKETSQMHFTAKQFVSFIFYKRRRPGI